MSRYSRTPVINSLKENSGTRFYSTTFYPDIPYAESDIFVVTVKGDRLDLLASQFYGDPNLWWVISISNKDLPQNSLTLPIGSQLRIPIDPSRVINLFNEYNS